MEHYDVAVVGLGALGSAAAYQLARRGAKVVGFEQFELGHTRGASHDSSRIVRTSYGSLPYVRFAQSAYRDWAELEEVSGRSLFTRTGGVIFIPVEGPYAASDFTTSLEEAGVPHELLSPAQVHDRWPQFTIPDGVETVYTADSGMVHAADTVATLQEQALRHGAVLRDRTPVEAVVPGEDGVLVRTAKGDVLARKVVLAADAWTNTLLEPLDAAIPLEIMQEQVTYFTPTDPDAYAPESFPVWIWEDELCFYGFPTFGEPTIKAGRDVSENYMTPDERSFEHSDELERQLSDFLGTIVPGRGGVERTITCQYAITRDRRFIIGALPRHPDVIVGLGAGHAFKFTPAFGRVLAELALDGVSSDDLSSFAVEPPSTVPSL